MIKNREKRKNLHWISTILFFATLALTLFSLNASAVGTPTVFITISRTLTTCVVINATYNETVTVPSTLGSCVGLTCDTDAACCNPKLTDQNGDSFSLSSTVVSNSGKTYVSTRCSLMPGIYDYNITGYNTDGSKSGGATFQMLPFNRTRCGDGHQDPEEECDDGNLLNNDNCDDQCRRAYCGNGRVDAGRGEECDGIALSGQNCFSVSSGYYGCGSLACNPSTCKFDMRNCSCEPLNYCGDGKVQPWLGEQCDGTNTGGIHCSDINPIYTGGSLSCRNCTLNVSNCIGAPSGGSCGGDGAVSRGEQCEGSIPFPTTCASFNFTGGPLTCNANICLFNVTKCNKTAPFCGDAEINPRNETCDGSNLGNFTSCSNLGMCSGPLSCGSDCHFTGCTTCPNLCGIVSPGLDPPLEECDIDFMPNVSCPCGGRVKCTGCLLDYSECLACPEYCGDGTLQSGEQCDPSSTNMTLRSKLCSAINSAFTAGSVTCNRNCTYNTTSPPCTGIGRGSCGDNITEVGEQCDGYVPSATTCRTFNFANGTLTCNPRTCFFNTSLCNNPPPYCGDNDKNQNDESCDGTDLNGTTTCQKYDPDLCSGTIACTNDCHFDISACIPCKPVTCNGIQMDVGEQCDGSDLGSQVCPYGGTLRCNGDCTLNMSSCWNRTSSCGNFVVDSCEQCDLGSANNGRGVTIGGLTCSDVNSAFTPNVGTVSCNKDCTYNTSKCYGFTGGGCPDGTVDVGEQCEGSDVNGRTCTDFGTFTTGSLTCNASTCKFDTCHCGGKPGYCGDNQATLANESCDGSDLRGQTCQGLGFYAGILSCLPNCQPNTAQCEPFPDYCAGDGHLDAGEECDGSNLNNKDCITMGYWGGTLDCYAPGTTNKCHFDTSRCTDPPNYCGNGELNPGEQCDWRMTYNTKFCSLISSTFTSGSMTCNRNCTYNTTYPPCIGTSGGSCGDTVIEVGEQCEGANLFGRTCQSFNFTNGTLTCNSRTCMFNTSLCNNPPPRCGDNRADVISLGEECDGTDLRRFGCTNFTQYYGGTLRCNDNCSFDFSSCLDKKTLPRCGDRNIDTGEECDSSDLNGMDCLLLGFAGGTLSCRADNCWFNTSQCLPYPDFCGNRRVDSCEECDAVMGNFSCVSLGFTGGSLGCNAAGTPNQCTLDTSRCYSGTGYCGDNVLERGERCDPSSGSFICSRFSSAFVSGGLSCNSGNCSFNTCSCVIGEPEPSCGDDIKNQDSEECDGADLLGRTCQSLGFVSGTLRCYGNCSYDTSGCSRGNYCGDTRISKPNSAGFNEECDGANLGGATCSNQVVTGSTGVVTCRNDCTLDLTNCSGPPPRCGDNLTNREIGELCDGIDFDGETCVTQGYYNGTLKCYPSTASTSLRCTFDKSACIGYPNYCGDGNLRAGEQCDGTNNNFMNCTDFGFTGGYVSCNSCIYNTSNCNGVTQGWCGDTILEKGEQCDGSVPPDTDCRDFGFMNGSLRCVGCMINTSDCITSPARGYCGDNLVQQLNGIGTNESCDGTNLHAKTCSNFDGYTSGALSCNGDCTFDFSKCTGPPPRCGDSVKNQGSEDCDLGDLNSETCLSLAYVGGTLTCNSTCGFNKSSCVPDPNRPYCGNNIAEAPNAVGFNEACDGADLGNTRCVDKGYTGGNLSCNGDCTFDYGACTSPPNFCGNYLVDSCEDCDEGPNGGTVSDLKCSQLSSSFTPNMGLVKCTKDCKFNTSSCIGITNGSCNDGTVEVGEHCDGGVGSLSCTNISSAFNGGILSCNITSCKLNTCQCTIGAPLPRCGDNVRNRNEEQCDGNDLTDTCRSLGYSSGLLKCTSDCKLNNSLCVPYPEKICGDGIIQRPNDAGFNESCDRINLGGRYCSSFDNYTGGTLACLGDCNFDFSECTGPPPKCGDGVRHTSLGEDCDGTDLGTENCLTLGYIGGTLSCNRSCGFNKSSCVPDPNRPYCGNNIVEAPNSVGFDESCDGSNLNSKVCSDFADYESGTLSCDGDCTFDYTACVKVRNYCGNYVVGSCEDCDEGPAGGIVSEMKCSQLSSSFTSGMGTVRCTKDCKFNTSSCIGTTGGSCGDKEVEVGEQCDGGVGSLSCTNISSAFNSGSLGCNPNCTFNTCSCVAGPPLPRCGDGAVNQLSEECDGTPSQTCRSLGYSTGTLRCSSDCKLDNSLCVPYPEKRCGDSIVQQPNAAGFNESCDGTNLNSRRCANFDNYTGGTLACLGDCNFDFSGCTGPVLPRCGDGVKNQDSEDCDGTSLNGQSCITFGYQSGILRCNSTCGFNKSSCYTPPEQPVCGDGIKNRLVEDCDGTDINGMACTNLDNFGSGVLTCSGDCTFNTANCIPRINRCGNGLINPGEQCEGNALNMSCSDFGFAGGTLYCRNCRYDTASCTGSTGGFCGDNEIVRGEQCDGGIGSLRCSDVNSAFNGGILSCNSSCILDTTQCTVGPPEPVCGDGLRNNDDEECDVSDLGGRTCLSLGFASGTLRCYAAGASNECKLNNSGCVPSLQPYCGDGKITSPNGVGFDEQCDGTALNSRTCTNFLGSEYTGGTLRCHTDCSYDYSGCTSPIPIRCGDNIKNQLAEDCDNTDLAGHTCISQGYTGGTLSCTSGCKFDKTSCTSIPPTPTTYCGDGSVQAPNTAGFNEQCDSTNLNGKHCTDFGDYTSGTLRCSGDCLFNYDNCIGPLPRCNDGVRNQDNEECDQSDLAGLSCNSLGYVSGDLSCTSSCKLNKIACLPYPNYCGDRIVEPGEQCDGSVPSGMVCSDFGFTSGAVYCNANCTINTRSCTGVTSGYCGDTTLEVGEQCDGSVRPSMLCSDFGFESGSLHCAGCLINTSSCTPRPVGGYCGDGSVQNPNGVGMNESCDSTNLNGMRCSSFDSYTGGILSCRGDCSFNYDGCTGGTLRCGDGIQNQESEECDGTDLNTLTCQSLGYASGTLRCYSSGTVNQCKLDKSLCVNGTSTYCGDNHIQAPNSAGLNEQCDSTALNSRTCISFGYRNGILACRGDCAFDYSGCNKCGDGIKNAEEECDGTDFSGSTCNSLGYLGGNLACTASCKLDKAGCISNPASLFCGDNKVQKPNDAGFSEQCDGNNLSNSVCSNLDEYTGGILGCYGDCTFNHSRCTGGPGPVCGNNIKDLGEECDGTDLSGTTCSSLGYAIGTLRCTSDCKFNRTGCRSVVNFCGDRIVQPGEECDGSVGGVTCADFGFTGGGSLSCTACAYDTSRCIGPTGGWCGDNTVAVGEQCDGSSGSMSCNDFGFMSGNLRCVNCDYNTSGCVAAPARGYCGDSFVQSPNGVDFNESCDSTNLNGKRCSNYDGYTGGILSCRGDCNFDFTDCTGPVPRCGDGVINQLIEECDLPDLDGQSCKTFGYVSGTLRCTSGCKLDKSNCVASPDPRCGDNSIQAPNAAGFDEQCDGTSLDNSACSDFDNYTGGTLRCRGDCSFDYTSCTGPPEPKCSDGAINQLIEECDNVDLGGETCQSLGYALGTLRCTSSCKFNKTSCLSVVNFCGDRIVQSGEQCDGSVGNVSCDDFGFTSGSVSCNSNCTYNTRSCTGPTGGWCGDGTVAVGEQCDGSVGIVNCKNFGLIDGAVRCINCNYNTSSCITPPKRGYCGDNIIQLPNEAGFNEQCDGTNLNSRQCNTLGLGYTSGTLACAGDCTFDYSGCNKCGDNIKNQLSEECDGADLGSDSCVSLGYASGTLDCTSSCKLDKSACVPIITTNTYCGDSFIQAPNTAGFNEQCDGTNLNGKHCTDFDNYTSGTLKCSGACNFDYSSCTGPVPRCGDGVKNRLAEDCDGADLGTENCITLGYASGTLKCNSACGFDSSGCIPAVNYCGNRILDVGEQCDGSVSSGLSCSDFGFTSGSVLCNPNCTYGTRNCIGNTGGYCGDATLEVNEQCDGTVGSMVCKDFGFMNGSLRCTGCMLNTSSCLPAPTRGYCGDSNIQQPNGAFVNESCDGINLNGKRCTSFDIYNGGALACLGDCSFDYSNCIIPPPGTYCGDGVVQQPNNMGLIEDCDDADLNGKSCESLGYVNGILRCTSGCSFDRTNCSNVRPTYCGDGLLQHPNTAGLNESCDSTNLNGKRCSNFDNYTSGILGCSGDCSFDFNDCTGPPPVCGDGVKNQLSEECDKTDFGSDTCISLGYLNGILKCTSGCKLDKTSCVPPLNFCGDSVVEPGEQCDGRVGNVTCVGLGFISGSVACNSNCTINTRGCTGPSGGVCGDGTVAVGEQCDGGVRSSVSCRTFGLWDGTVSCLGCYYNTSSCVAPSSLGYCGDGGVQKPNYVGFNEECDGTNLGGKRCSDVGNYNGGTLRCRGDCTFDYNSCTFTEVAASCGDSIVQTPNAAGFVEQCDGTNVSGHVCTDFASYTSGALRCNGVCSFDYSSCIGSVLPHCGDGAKNALSEECDGSDVGSQTCVSLGFASGTLSCTSACKLNKSSCVSGPDAYCGDGSVQKPNDVGFVEQCDGTNLDGRSCVGLDNYTGGILKCRSDCSFDFSNCTKPVSLSCGDGVKNRFAEDCDSSDLAGHTCKTQGFESGTLSCTSGCKFDKSGCSSSPGTFCGDGAVQQPNSANLAEDCDGSDLNGESCTSLGYISGTLRCTTGCRFDKIECSNVRPTYCGDGLLQHPNTAGLNESCDSTNINGKRCSNFDNYTSGTLACSGDCSFDFNECTGPPPSCGDGVKNQLSEECDKTDFGSDTCISLGYLNGSLKCTSGCKLDKTSCVPPLNFCGDRIIEPGEQCDGSIGNISCASFGFTSGFVSCNSNCTYNTRSCTGATGGYCGDSSVAVGEQCDGSVRSSISCRTFSLWDGTVSCVGCYYNTSSCVAPSSLGYCGDGGVQQPNWVGFNEACDGNNLGGKRCSDVGNYNGGTLRCRGDCTFDYTNCTSTRVAATCGDSSIQAPNSAGFNEQCDGTNLNSKICSSFTNYTSGTLRCNGDCSFDYSTCTGVTPICGDNVKNQLTEECDSSDLGIGSCQSLGYASGTLSCTSACKLNKSSCVSGPGAYCGDGSVQQPNIIGFIEQCDSTSLNGKICSSFPGYSSGTLACHGDCTFDYAGCTNIATLRCGDNVKNRLTEDCDGTDLAGHTCKSQGYVGGALSCTAGCKFDKSKCSSVQTNTCGDGVVQQPNSLGSLEDCDGYDFNGETCISLGYIGGNLKCTTACKLDKSGCISVNATISACGDYVVQAPNRVSFFEQCDSSNLNNMQCTEFDTYTGGNLACYGDCTRDYRACTGGTFVCGDGVRNLLTEECDGTDYAGQSCKTFGYINGSLKCTSACKLDKTGCSAAPATYCGDSTIQSPNGANFNEQCDGTNLNSLKCTDFGHYTGGTLKCYTACSYDYSKCTGATPVCGDDVKNQGTEECDANDFAGQTCKSLGYASGTLKCTSGCRLDKSGCVRGNVTYCGDSSVQKPNGASFNEQCDSTSLNGKDCTDFDYAGGNLICKGDCTFSYDNCTISTQSLCGDGVKNGQELCDKNDWGMITGCASFSSFKSGILSCLLGTCHFDTSKCVSNNTVLELNSSCYDTQKDGDETDVDCGGTCFPCPDGKACAIGNDCQSMNCKAGTCAGANCQDGVRNGIETDVDCGADCPQCDMGKGCGIDSDCITTFCNPATLLCSLPACDDEFLNGDESDTDCGGGCPVKCSMGKQCRNPGDCQSGVCEVGICTQDRNLDTDGDGMPDFWEDKYGLDKNNPADANEDMDGDGYTNLQEYQMGSDPTNANDPQVPGTVKSHTLQIILLIIGILFMAGSAGFLIYSRKVIVPQQQKILAAQKKPGVPPPLGQRPLLRRPLSRLTQPQSHQSQLSKPGLGMPQGQLKSREKPGAAGTAGLAGASAGPETKEQGAKISGEGEEPKEPKEEYIDISELGKQSDNSGKPGDAKAGKKPSGDVFKRLKDLIASRKKKPEEEAEARTPEKNLEKKEKDIEKKPAEKERTGK